MSLETPTVFGFGLVLLMGSGNFLGTRFATSAVLLLIGSLEIFLSCSGWNILPEIDKPSQRLSAVNLLQLAVLLPFLQSTRHESRHRVNRLWDDFRNFFGLVWALRMVERINALAVQQRWTIRLSLEGFPETAAGRSTPVNSLMHYSHSIVPGGLCVRS